MKTVVAALHPPTDGRKPRAAGTNAEWLAMKPVQEPDAARKPTMKESGLKGE